MKLALDPGHGFSNKTSGSYDCGACAGGIQEADLALQWALTLKWALVQAGIACWLSRADDRDAAPVGNRDERARAAGCTHFLSIHANAGSILTSGVETFFRDGEDQKFACIVHAACLRATGLRDRGVRNERETAVHRLAVMDFRGPCALVEVGYLTCPRDRRIIAARETRVRFAAELAKRLRALGS